ncbi:hypothetical protein RDV64_23785 (plasmid) [Acuticoccus sp. MNP-M23]|uniref:ribbon-helix-helix domain-containing protein n=1 Tax=Acuticoccus sp. MNP-M23 TaxID=3072793 RepID=UPI002814D82C|nr:ribbon-helix-helix domain-containing protein [Acuticoccus sp. MNP-M23]WMS45377.1 hypothetical protein RDV64_23785 [Acuticoccus sp. MNP-M23]
MSVKRKPLSGIQTRPIETPKAAPEQSESPTGSTVQSPERPVSQHHRPSRADKAQIAAFFPPEVRKQLKLIAVEQDKTVQQLMGEALNLLFAQYQRAEIAPTERR